MKVVSRYKIWFSFSLIVTLVGILSLIFWGLPLGIDFKGGSSMELKYSQKVNSSEVENSLKSLNLKNLIVQSTSQNTVIIKTGELAQGQEAQIKEIVNAKVGESGQEIRFENIGPTVGKDLQRKAIIAIILACFGIILYLAYAFRTVPPPISSWKFGVCAVAALVHDTVVIIGLYSVMAHLFGFEVDAYFVTAILTIIGFSVHDTIVVFDRIRENLISRPQWAGSRVQSDHNSQGAGKSPALTIEENIDHSIVQTMIRSLNTSITVLVVLATMLILGGSSIRHFVATLFVGIIFGTYSSIFIASPILFLWQRWTMRRTALKNAS